MREHLDQLKVKRKIDGETEFFTGTNLSLSLSLSLSLFFLFFFFFSSCSSSCSDSLSFAEGDKKRRMSVDIPG